MACFWTAKRRKLVPVTATGSASDCASITPTKHDSAVLLPLTTTCSPPKSPPIHSLPVELIQYITSFLPGPCASSFCLTDRYICYAVGRQQLYSYLRSDPSTFGKRKNIEILERAFPSHWYCAWCDRFHRHDKEGGPRSFGKEAERNCAEFNSYLHAGKNYALCFHHVRLAINRASWGDGYGIPVEDFSYHKGDEFRIGKKLVPTTVEVEARVVSGRLFLHSMFAVVVPCAELQKKRFEEKLKAEIPQIVLGHRDDKKGHTGLMLAVKQALVKNSYERSELCYTCATDWAVQLQDHTPEGVTTSQKTASVSPVLLKVESWRDLGNGRNPFCASWRAHGEIGTSTPGFGGDIMRLTTFTKGEIRRGFEKGYDIKLPFRFGMSGDPKLMKAWEEMLQEDWRRDIVAAGREYSQDIRAELERREAERREAEGGLGIGGLVGWQTRQIRERFRAAGYGDLEDGSS